jgi:hypothetical protein
MNAQDRMLQDVRSVIQAGTEFLRTTRTVLLRPLPYTGPERLLNIAETALLLRQRQRGQIRCLLTTQSFA